MRRNRRWVRVVFGSCLGFSMLSVAQGPVPAQPIDRLNQEFKAAVSAYELGRLEEAAHRLQMIEARRPNSFEVQELLGLTYGAQGQEAHALEHLQAAAKLKPTSALAWTNLATGSVRAGRVKEAATQYRKALEIEPEDYGANRNLAELYLRENRISEAIPLLRAAERVRPAAYDNGYDLALAYLMTDQIEEARSIAVNLLRQKDSGELHNLLGQANEKQGSYVEAAKEFSIAARIDPSEDNLFVWASELLLHRTYEPAVAVFRDATQRFPKSSRLWIGLGMSLYSRGEYEESIRSLITAAKLDPRDPRCYLFLSKAYLSSPSQAEDVISTFRNYAELEPKNALAQYYYGVSLWKGRRVDHPDVDYKAVESLLVRSITLDGTNAEVHLQLGILYNDQRVYEKALPEYERALSLNPGLADAHFRLGRYYLRAGEKDRAQTEFDTSKKLQTQHQAEIDKERAEVQQFVVANKPSPSIQQ